MKKFFVVFLIFVLLLAGCKKQPEGKAVYVIDGKPYTLNEIVKDIGITQTQFNSLKPEEQKAYLDMWLTNELLYKEALSRGIDKDTLFMKKMEYLKKQLLVNTLFQNIMQATSQTVSPQEVQTYYNQHLKDYSTERRIAHITVPTKDMAIEVINRLRQGESFSRLAREYSIDSTTARQGGVIGWFTRGDFAKYPEFEDSIFGMKKVGDFSGPVQSPFTLGYDVLKLLGVRKLRKPRTLQEVQNDIGNMLTIQKQKTIFDSLMVELKKKFKVQELGEAG